MSSGKFYSGSKVWAEIPHGGPNLERWRGFHQPHGAPHPPAWEDEALVLELMPALHRKYYDHMHALAWACEDAAHDGPVMYVVFPWCTRCVLRSKTGRK